MSSEMYGLSASDIAVLKRLIHSHNNRTVNTPNRPFVPEGDWHENQQTEGYVIKSPSGGISALSDGGTTATPGDALCDVYRISLDLDNPGQWLVIPTVVAQKRVFNLSGDPIPGNVYAFVDRDKFGNYLINAPASEGTPGTLQTRNETAGPLGSYVWNPTAKLEAVSTTGFQIVQSEVGDTGTGTSSDGITGYDKARLLAASVTQMGAVTITSQQFAGMKSFRDGLQVCPDEIDGVYPNPGYYVSAGHTSSPTGGTPGVSRRAEVSNNESTPTLATNDGVFDFEETFMATGAFYTGTAGVGNWPRHQHETMATTTDTLVGGYQVGRRYSVTEVDPESAGGGGAMTSFGGGNLAYSDVRGLSEGVTIGSNHLWRGIQFNSVVLYHGQTRYFNPNTCGLMVLHNQPDTEAVITDTAEAGRALITLWSPSRLYTYGRFGCQRYDSDAGGYVNWHGLDEDIDVGDNLTLQFRAGLYVGSYSTTGTGGHSPPLIPPPLPIPPPPVAGTSVILGQCATDPEGDPIVGRSITLSGANSGTTTTDARGNYGFSSLTPGGTTLVTFDADPTEVVAYDVDGTGYTSGDTAPVTLVADTLHVVTFRADETGTGSGTTSSGIIAGTVADGIGIPLSGRTVTLSGGNTATVTTNGSGNYSFSGLSLTSTTATCSPAGGFSMAYNLDSAGYTGTTGVVTFTVSGTHDLDFQETLTTP